MTPRSSGGPIAWMVNNRVSANLLMLFLIIGGIWMSTRIKQEVFPEFDLDLIRISAPYPGASPAEVERGIILAVEQALEGLPDVKEIRSVASEGSANITVELIEGSDTRKAYQLIEQAVSSVTTVPDNVEQIRVSPVRRRREVLDLQIYGDVSALALRHVVEKVRDRLLLSDEITMIELEDAKDVELHVEISQENLRAFGLTIQQVAAKLRASSVEAPGGRVETIGGELLLRVKDRKEWAHEFAKIPIVTTRDGAVRRLGDIATIREGFEEFGEEGSYKGMTSATLEVYRVGKQGPIQVSDAVREAMAEIEADLPDGVFWEINRDRSDTFRQRLELLLRNAFIGLALVLVLLGLFLDFKLAFWVTMGIPTAFLGGMLFLPAMGASLNMISMFAFIIALGIVVDDAVVAGENIHEMRQRGLPFHEAAIAGAKGVATPVGFAILTNILCFLPLMFVPGFMGKIWKVIPVVVIVVFLISWLECLLIMPAHLAHDPVGEENQRKRLGGHAKLRPPARLLAWFVNRVYAPFLAKALAFRFTTIAVCVGALVAVSAYVAGGHIGMTAMPRVESDVATVTVQLPNGTSRTRVAKVRDDVVAAMDKVAEANGGDTLLIGTFVGVNQTRIRARAYLTQPGIRPLSTREVAKLWRKELGPVPGAESTKFESDRGGPGSGAALTIELSHRDTVVLDKASAALAAAVEGLDKTSDVDDGYARGKEQLSFSVTPDGEALGLTAAEVASQVRGAFYGTRALRQQRGNNEVTVLVRRAAAERSSEYDIDALLITTPAGTRVPLRQVAKRERGRAHTSINRRNGRRTISVTANVTPIGDAPQLQASLEETTLPKLVQDFPGLGYSFEGRQAWFAEGISALASGFAIALLLIYFLLAIPFKSYVQPAIVMLAIPFGLAGAVVGHMVMGFNISMLSMMGGVALSGVVVNDALVLVEYANQQRNAGYSAREAVFLAATRRFRPVILTTITTFGGMAPMIFETSRQARFLIPMAIALGFGIVFATVVTLVLVPTLYLVVEDVRDLFRFKPATPAAESEAA